MAVPFRALWPTMCCLQLVAAQHSRWDDRLAARVGRPVGPLPTPAAPSEAPSPAASSEAVRQELQSFVQEYVEPAIAILRAHETLRGNDETCFASPGGQHLRYRCCVYFSSLAAAMLEWQFGSSTARGGAAVHLLDASHPSHRHAAGAHAQLADRRVLYRLLARWCLQPAACSLCLEPHRG